MLTHTLNSFYSNSFKNGSHWYMRKWSKKKSEVIPGRNTQNYQILVLPYTIYRIWMDPAMWPNTEKWAASDHNFRVLIVCTEDTQFVEWASEEWNRPCKAVTKELLLRARTAPYLAFSAKNRKETKKIRRQMKMKKQWSKIHEMKQKQFLRAKFIAIEA